MKFHEPLLPEDPVPRGPDQLWMRRVAALNEAARIQGGYKVYKNEMRDPNEANHSRREPTEARRSRLSAIVAQGKA